MQFTLAFTTALKRCACDSKCFIYNEIKRLIIELKE